MHFFPLWHNFGRKKCVTKGNFVSLREKISDISHLGFVTKSHWHTINDTFSLSDTILQLQKICHLGYVNCIWLRWWIQASYICTKLKYRIYHILVNIMHINITRTIFRFLVIFLCTKFSYLCILSTELKFESRGPVKSFSLSSPGLLAR